ncbi:HAMP domain-containing histidine kinase [Micromonospora sp. DR5-3]|uniref:sensor histidine kinase n=1 Tax=unclassified Micromonospora TaxID=2617518 RepID=UPI001652A631|nr:MULTISPECIES: HAMP domain-containing sensor histidine kinase [unclassified Micromonospora]MCW3820587.1 HAMP domain-containing histidine kinase [Micromonospora sp. DR5-3]
MPATERPRLRTRLALLYATTAVVLGAVPVAVVGLGTWTGRSTQAVGAAAGGGTVSNTGPVLVAVAVGLLVVALVAAPIGWALAGRAVRPLRELTSAAEGATADRLPEHGELGRYEEFADLSATLAGLYTRLDAAYAAQRRFVADASHELRTPLTVHRTLIQVTLADPDADATSFRALCEELLRIGNQQERLVTALLALAQGQQGSGAAQPVDLATLAAEAVTVRGSAAAGPTIRADIQRAVVARSDPTLLASLIGNLLDNAIHYNLDGGRVDVETRCDGTRAVLAISNTGPVVPEDAIDRILQPFQRLAAPRMHTGSRGLGLAIVRAIVDSHGADLRVVPNPEGGLTITVGFAAA